MYQVLFHSVFLCQLHAHTYAIKNVLAETVFVVFQEIQCLHNFNHDDVHQVTELTYISLPSFMLVRVAVSEIHDLNQNKKKEEKNFEKAIYHFSQKLTHFLMRVDHIYTLNLLEV